MIDLRFIGSLLAGLSCFAGVIWLGMFALFAEDEE